jgi:hypothetical protein
MKPIVLALFIGLLAAGSFATSVTVTSSTVATDSGYLTSVYYENANGRTGAAPNVNTALSPPGTTGSYAITRGSSDILWSSHFSSATTIPAGPWGLDLWALASSSGSLTVSIVITNSAGTTTATVLSTGSTSAVGTSKKQVFTSFSGSGVAVPADGYVKITLTAPTGGGNPSSFTVYWGKGQLTSFQFNTVIASQ